MAFYDSYPQCSKCCFFVNLRHGVIVLGILSLLIRFTLFIVGKYFWIQSAFSDRGDDPDMFLAFLQVAIAVVLIIILVLGTVADVLSLLGAFQRVQKYVRLYLPIMFSVFVLEILLFIVLFVMGFHWAHVIDILLLGAFHVWCWFTAHSLNQQWNLFVPSSGNKPEDFETLPSEN